MEGIVLIILVIIIDVNVLNLLMKRRRFWLDKNINISCIFFMWDIFKRNNLGKIRLKEWKW